MRDRIKLIMEAENLTPARFADSLNIGRAVISHILNGRNNPSLDVITRILAKMPNINSDWLLSGIGEMYRKVDTKSKTEPKVVEGSPLPNLFANHSDNDLSSHSSNGESKYRKDNAISIEEKLIENILNERVTTKDRNFRKIKQIIICYNDNTFETFGDK